MTRDRKSPFEIDTELRVRKILESVTDHRFEFIKNNNPFGYDLVANKYTQTDSLWKVEPIAFIEIEVSSVWVDSYPSNWKTYSFLKRKVYKFDYHSKQYTDELKPYANNTIYFLLNKTMSDSICARISDIAKMPTIVGKETGNLRQDSYLRIDLDYKQNFIKRGLENCIDAIKKYLSSAKPIESCDAI